jgi:hypothetical protein
LPSNHSSPADDHLAAQIARIVKTHQYTVHIVSA